MRFCTADVNSDKYALSIAVRATFRDVLSSRLKPEWYLSRKQAETELVSWLSRV